MFIRPVAALAALCLIGFAPMSQAADKPTDPQIAHIAYTAGVIDVEAAKLAVSKSKNTVVVDFANQMIRDHGVRVGPTSVWKFLDRRKMTYKKRRRTRPSSSART